MSEAAQHDPKRQLSRDELAEILGITLHAGVMMLRSGSASFRAEEVMLRIAEALGVERLDAYVTPTGIIATAFSGREHRTQIHKVPLIGVDMNRVVELEMLSRNLTTSPQPEQINARLRAIEAMGPLYPRPLVIAVVAVACGAFALILGGGVFEFISAACGAAAAQTLRFRMVHAHFNPIPITVACAALSTAISYALAELSVRLAPALGLAVTPRLGVIASVLLLVPGVPMVTSVLDITRLDLLSGVIRAVYAFVLILSIAIGMLLILAWTGLRIL